jgi:hypothetical protein
MLRKTSVSMMVLLVAASLIGISSIHQFVEGQTPPPAATPKPQQPVQKATYVMGTVTRVVNYASSDGKACIAMVTLPSGIPNNLNLEPGESIALLAPNESFCTLFGQSKISKTQILVFIAQKIIASSLPRAIQADPTVIWETFNIYRITRVDML